MWDDAPPSANEFYVGWCSTFFEMNSSSSMDSVVVSSMPVNFSNVAMSVSCTFVWKLSALQEGSIDGGRRCTHTVSNTHASDMFDTVGVSAYIMSSMPVSFESFTCQVKRSQQEVGIERESAAKELGTGYVVVQPPFPMQTSPSQSAS